MSDREIGIREARPQLGDLVIDAATRGQVTYLTRYGDRWAALVPLDRVVPEVEDATWVRHDEDGTQLLRLEVVRRADAGIEVWTTGRTDGVETSPRSLERCTDSGDLPHEVEAWVDGYRAWLAGEGFGQQ